MIVIFQCLPLSVDQVEEEHFGPSGDMEVLCRATVSAVYTDQGSPEAMPVVLEHREDLIRGKKRYSLLKKTRTQFRLANNCCKKISTDVLR